MIPWIDASRSRIWRARSISADDGGLRIIATDDLALAASDNLDLVQIPSQCRGERIRQPQSGRGDDASIDLHQRVTPELIESELALASHLEPDARAIAEFLGRGLDEIHRRRPR